MYTTVTTFFAERGISMRRFSFASGYFRDTIDLQKYESIIINAVHEVIPNAKVTVFHDSYVIDKVTKGESIKIGRKLASTQLCGYCIKISKLWFTFLYQCENCESHCCFPFNSRNSKGHRIGDRAGKSSGVVY